MCIGSHLGLCANRRVCACVHLHICIDTITGVSIYTVSSYIQIYDYCADNASSLLPQWAPCLSISPFMLVTCINACICTHLHLHAYNSTHFFMHERVHTHTHTLIHTYTQKTGWLGYWFKRSLPEWEPSSFGGVPHFASTGMQLHTQNAATPAGSDPKDGEWEAGWDWDRLRLRLKMRQTGTDWDWDRLILRLEIRQTEIETDWDLKIRQTLTDLRQRQT